MYINMQQKLHKNVTITIYNNEYTKEIKLREKIEYNKSPLL